MLIRKPLLIAALLLSTSSAIAQDSINLTPAQARDVAVQALLGGQSELSISIAEALLRENPDDRTALLVIATSTPRIGDPDRGRKAGARAWSLSTTDAQRYEAARVTANAAAVAERYTLATFWLRRALNVSPNAQERRRTLNDASRIARINPWSTNLSFSLAPSSNLNDGAEDEELSIDGNATGGSISADGVALAGWRAILGASTQYRFYEDPNNRASVGLTYQAVRVRITEDTEVTDEALSTDVLQMNLRYDRALAEGTLGLMLAESVYQYRDFDLRTLDSNVERYRISRIGLDRRLPLSERSAVTFTTSRARVLYSDTSGLEPIHRTRVGASFVYRRENDDRMGLSFSLGVAESNDLNSVQRDQSVSFSYSWADPIGPVSVSAGIGATWRRFPDYVVFDPNAPGTAFGGTVPLAGGRNDETVFANLNIGFPEVEYFGFRPGIRIDANRTNSNFSRFETTRVSAGFTLSSAF